MNTKRFSTRISIFLGLAMAFPSLASADVAELRERGISLKVDAGDVAISGISSGAAMATQVFITHGDSLVGVGSVAGPPYRCANLTLGNPVSLGLMSPSLYAATQICTNATETKVKKIDEQDQVKLQTLTEEVLARSEDSDGWAGVCGSRVILIAGEADTMVPADVSGATAKQYQWLSAECGKRNLPALILTNPPPRAGMPHTMPTDAAAMPQNCPAGPPYIADCDYEGGTNILKTLHPKAQEVQGRVAKEQNLIRFRQSEITKYEGQMHDYGYVYVPDACQKGEKCPLHVALHGCKQNENLIARKPGSKDRYLFARDAGYNDEAERLGIVVLYPQAKDSPYSNPNGCWDWWGYADPAGFYKKDGIQLRTLWKVIEAFSR